MMTKTKLDKTLKTKIPLSFRADGKYKILFFSDIHCYPGCPTRVLDAMERMVEDKQPDLVLWAGDGPQGCKTRKELVDLIGQFSSPMEKRGIPWAMTNGNHATRTCYPLTVMQVERVYEKFEYCLNSHVKGIHGYTNYVLPIYSANAPEKIALNVFSLDTGTDMSDIDEGRFVESNINTEIKMPNPPMGITAHNFDIIRFDQLSWYWDVSTGVEKHYGKAPAIMFTHCCPHEMKVIQENPEETGAEGRLEERIRTGPINSGVFATVLERGDVIGFYFGHNHNNTGEGKFCGIRMGYVGSVGYYGYGMKGTTDAEKNRFRGARLLTFDESDIANYTSEFMYNADYVEHLDS